MSFFDTLLKGLFPSRYIIIIIAVVVLIVLYVMKTWKDKKEKEKGEQAPKEPRKCNKTFGATTPEKVKEGFVPLYSEPNRATGIYATDFSSINNSTSPFAQTELDNVYDDYEITELEAQDSKDKSSNTIQIEDEVLPNYGAAFAAVDGSIKEIPWDSDNKDYLQSDVVWGIVSYEASKSIYLKAYHDVVLSDPDSLNQTEDGVVSFHSPILGVDVSDPYAGLAAQTVHDMVIQMGIEEGGKELAKRGLSEIVARRIMAGNKKLSRAEALKAAKEAIQAAQDKLKNAIIKAEKQLGAALKKILGPERCKQILAKITQNIAPKVAKRLAITLGITIAEEVVAEAALTAVQVELAVADVVTLGATTPFSILLTSIQILLGEAFTAIEILTVWLGAVLPIVLEKYLDGNGICTRGRPIDIIIDDEIGYFFFTMFVPIAPIIDIFGPYICWEGAEAHFKERVYEPAYYSDKTLSLFRHIYPPEQTIGGDRYEFRSATYGDSTYDCLAGFCRKNCEGDTYTTTRVDALCNQGFNFTTMKIPNKYDCNSTEMRGARTSGDLDWASDGTSCWEHWRGLGGGDCHTEGSGWSWRVVCDPVYNKGGCGCIKKTAFDRYYCNNDFELDRAGSMCYEKCPGSRKRYGCGCWGDRLTYARDMVLARSKKVQINGYQAPRNLSDVTIPWCNFGSPVMLDRMAQFYYNQSMIHPTLNDISGSSVPELEWEFITKFFGVIASSELSCDVACSMKTVKYNAFTGEDYKEDNAGCTYDDSPLDQMCYRRFYFIKGVQDPQGIFTVTGCTNSDYTAPDSQFNSWEVGREYVPSLPKVFNVTEEETPPKFTASDYVAIAVGIVGAAVSTKMTMVANPTPMTMLTDVGTGLAVGAATQKINDDQESSNKAAEIALDLALGSIQGKINNSGGHIEGTYLVGKPTAAFVITGAQYAIDNKKAFITINQGPVKEQATGLTPSINFCEVANISASQCTYKYTLRDTINRYQLANPTRRVKQVDIIEPRGKDGCYYRWKEVTYNPSTNSESTDYKDSDIIQQYEIKNNNTCIFEAKGFVSDLTAYPMRTFDFNLSTNYSTRTKITKPVRYVRIEGGTNQLMFSQIIVRNTQNENISKNKPVTSSDVFNASTPAKNGVDGNEFSRPYPAIYHSNAGNAYFEIDLQKEEYINTITMYGRVEGTVLDQRLQGYTLKCLDATRILNYSFPLVGTDVIQHFTEFPAIALERKYPSRSFLVPQTLPTETTLGGTACPSRKCSDRGQIDALVTQFNDANTSAKILKVTKAVTPTVSRCDYEVEMMRFAANGSKSIQRETIRFNVAENSLQKCLFDRVSDGLAMMNSGTFVQSNSPPLANTDTSGGVMTVSSVISSVKNLITSIVKPIKDADPLKVLRENAKTADTTATSVLAAATANQTLSGCPTKCTDPAVLQAIKTAYNLNLQDVTSEAFGIERSTMRRILKAGVASPTECDVMFEEMYEAFDDILYDPTIAELRIKAKRFKMEKQGTTCAFQVAEGVGAVTDISSNAVSLLSEISNLTVPFVGTTCKIDCRSATALQSVKKALEIAQTTAKSTTNYTQVVQSFQNGATVCEYKLLKNVTTQNTRTRKFTTVSDLETYVTASFQLSQPACTPTINTVNEYEPDGIETRFNPATKDTGYYYKGTFITPPLLYTYDDSTPSTQVDARDMALK